MADEAPVKLIQIGPKGGAKKDGFNLVTERVVAVNPEAKQLEVELLAYDGKSLVLDVAEEALEDLQKIKVGDGATIRVVEEGGKRIAKSFRIRAKDPNAAKADAMLVDLKDSHWLNRKYAAEVLGELKDPRAVGPLVDALTDEVGDVRQRAYDSLIKIGGTAVPSLVPLLVSEEDELRQSVTEIIRKIGKPAVEPLATALADRYVPEPVGHHPIRIIHVPQIEQQRVPHRRLQAIEIQISELIPLGHDHQRVRPFRDIVGIVAGDHLGQQLDRLFH